MVTVEYQVGAYCGTLEVSAKPSDSDASILAKAKAMLADALPANMYVVSMYVVRKEAA